MKLKKTLVMFLVALLIVPMAFLLSGCVNQGNHPRSDSSIDPQLEIRVRQAFANANSDVSFRNAFVMRYFGTFDGASVVRMTAVGRNYTMEAWSETIGGVWFGMGNPRITVFKNGGFVTLQQAYDKDFLTVANLAVVATQNNAPKIDPETYQKIKLARQSLVHPGDIYWQWEGFAYYGTFNGASAIMFNGYGGDMAWYEEIAGVRFYYSDTRPIEIFKDGGFFRIQEAYNRGYLAVADLQSIQNLHRNRMNWWGFDN